MTETTLPDLANPRTRELCGTMEVHRRLLNESITYQERRALIENRAMAYEQPGARRRADRRGYHSGGRPRGAQSGRPFPKHQRGADPQPDRGPQPGFPGWQPRCVQGAGACGRTGSPIAISSSGSRPRTRTAIRPMGSPGPSRRSRLSAPTWTTSSRAPPAAPTRGPATTTSTSGCAATSGTHRPVDPRIRAVPRRPSQHRRRRHRELVLRHGGNGAGSLRPRPHRHARDRPLAGPAAHLGRRPRLVQRKRPGRRHAQPGRPHLRQADVPADQLQQRTRRRTCS